MQIRLSQRNLDLLIELWVEMTNKWINDFLFIKLTWNTDLQTILKKLDWLWEKTTWPIKKSCFSDDTTFNANAMDITLGLSEGQIRYWNDLIKQAVEGLNEKGFKWMYYYYESLGYNISWKLEEYVKDGLREAIGKRADIDYTLFKI